ncbi:MAG: hypothetical protein JHD07_07365, partial [Bradyrhizobium sp.]|nr:hypothetical protein [Bradyrhizobium sp.]
MKKTLAVLATIAAVGVTAVAAPGVTLTATMLNAATVFPDDLDHGAPITFAWDDDAVHDDRAVGARETARD